MSVAFMLFPFTRLALRGWKGHCLCVIPVENGNLVVDRTGAISMMSSTDVTAVADSPACDGPKVLSIRIGPDACHWITAGLTCFARSLNDTPKMAFLILGFSFVGVVAAPNVSALAFVVVAVSMSLGSFFGGRKVTQLLAEKVTRMDHQEGFNANLTTAALVTAAANLGLPVSTTLVSSSAIIGMGLRNGVGAVDWKTVSEMLAAWVVTLPIAGLLSAGCWYFLKLF